MSKKQSTFLSPTPVEKLNSIRNRVLAKHRADDSRLDGRGHETLDDKPLTVPLRLPSLEAQIHNLTRLCDRDWETITDGIQLFHRSWG